MEIEQLLLQARKAKDAHDYLEAERLYCELLELVPDSWEAQFYSIYYSSIRNDVNGMSEAHLRLYKGIIDILKTNAFTADERMATHAEIANRIQEYVTLSLNKLTDYIRSNPSVGVKSSIVIINALGFAHLQELSADLMKDIAPKSDVIRAYNMASEMAVMSGDRDLVRTIQTKIQDLGFSQAPSQAPSRASYQASSQTNGCYVATAVYGSYDCPEVWTLRRFRDYHLALTWYGRLFIHLYYAISPTLVKCFGNKTWFKKMWKSKLDRFVDRLRAEGYDATPYSDLSWK